MWCLGQRKIKDSRKVGKVTIERFGKKAEMNGQETALQECWHGVWVRQLEKVHWDKNVKIITGGSGCLEVDVFIPKEYVFWF